MVLVTPFWTCPPSTRMEHVQNPLHCSVLYLPASSEEIQPLKLEDLVVADKAELLFLETVTYPHFPTSSSLPTHVRGLFYAPARLASDSDASESQEVNMKLQRSFKKRIRGSVAVFRCLVPVTGSETMLQAMVPDSIERDTTLADYAKLEAENKFISPGFNFIERELQFPVFYCPLGKYLEPYPIPTPDAVWNCPKWSPKQLVYELFIQIGSKPNYFDATEKDLGIEVLQRTQEDKRFYQKLEIRRVDQDGVEHIEPDVFLSPHGSFSKKTDSQVAAAVDYLQFYHMAWIKRTDPELYAIAEAMLGLGSTEVQNTEKTEKGGKVEFLDTKLDDEVPYDIKKPTIAIWEALVEQSKEDFFGNGTMIKSILKTGNGPFLGISTQVPAWVSVLSYEDDGFYALLSSKLQNVAVGAIHPQIPVVALPSMRIGESAYFWLSEDIVRKNSTNENELFQQVAGKMIIAICIPDSAHPVYSGSAPTLSSISTPLEDRLRFCNQCDQESVTLYKRGFYKLALDHYQIGFAELATSNDALFMNRTLVLRANIEWIPELEAFKAAVIRNRLGVAACCLYIKDWPKHVPNWKILDNATAEGVAACDVVLKLDPHSLIAHRRKTLLLINANKFEEARASLNKWKSMEGVNQKDVDQATLSLTQREKKASDEAFDFAKRIFH